MSEAQTTAAINVASRPVRLRRHPPGGRSVERTRRAVLAALGVVLTVGGAAFAAASDQGAGITAAVSWPTSTLLVSEIQTGGSSASDEFAEITNVGAGPVDLAGLEIVYVTSAGSTVTRKASWTTSLLLEPGRHLFIANSSGIYAGLADATYSGGFAATGGAIVLRAIGGAPVDAAGWGDATNAFVEGLAAAAPAAGSSIERRPAGLAGNTIDTNDNAADFLVQPAPNPQNLGAPPVPAPGPTAVPSPAPTTEASATPTATVEPSATPVPTTAPSATPVPATPVPTPAESPTPEPTIESSLAPSPSSAATSEPPPTPEPTPTVAPRPTDTPTPTLAPTFTPEPTPEVSPSPTVAPTAVPTASPFPAITILAARALPDGATAQVEGVLTTGLGALESGRKGFIQDESGGIAIYLDAAVVDALPAGTLVRATGILDERFAERTLRANLADVIVLGAQQGPEASGQQTGAIGEQVEGLRVLVQGVTVGGPSELSDGLGLMVDDGSGAVRVIVGPAALGGAGVPSGTAVVAAGPVGQRDSSGTGLSGYRVHVTEPGDFGLLPQPTPTPAPSQTPVPTSTTSPSAAPSATPAASASPSPSPTPSPSPALTIVEARARPIGAMVTVTGVVTAEAGRIGLPPLLAIADSTGGIIVRLPEGAAPPARGTVLLVRGAIADPYGQLELRPSSAGFAATGHGSLPVPLRLSAVELGEATEGRLAELTGTVASAPQKGTSGNFTVNLTDASGGAFRLLCDVSAGIDPATLVKGRAFRVTGIVGQRASRKDALDGYRVYLRDTADVVAVAGPPGPEASPGQAAVSIATALAYADETPAIVEGTVTAHATLLDATGRRIVIQDATGAIEVLLPSGSTAPSIGTRVRVTGAIGHAYGAPRIGVTNVESLGKGSAVSPVSLGRPPAERDEWQLVRISGRVEKVERMGDRWRAEIVLSNGSHAPVHGQAGAGIPSTAIVVGRPITVIGIVRRPYPTASDRRFGVLPRDAHDLALGPAAGTGGGGGATGQTGTGAGAAGAGGASPTPAGIDITPDTDLAVLADHLGARVRVGGLITTLTNDGFDLDDGTAIAHVRLRGAMAELLPHLQAGEAIAATGVVELEAGAAIVVVDEAGALFRVGSLGEALPIAGAAGPGASLAPGGEGALEANATGLGPDLAPASALTLAGLALLSVVATVLRRQLQQRRLRAILVARLAGLRAGDPAPEPDAELAPEPVVEVHPAGPARVP
jgi:hypothetical protein